MITPEFLQGCTDDQINKGVAWLEVKSFDLTHAHGIRSSLDMHAAISILMTPHNYCASPDDAMPIAFANEITIKPMNNCMWPDWWESFENKAEGVKSYNKNPLRAAMGVYLLMSN